MDVVRLTRDRETTWEQFVEGSPQASLAHRLGWRNVVEKTYHHRAYYLMAMDGEALAGILPLFLIRSPFFGHFLVTAPYLSYGGLIADNERAASALIEAARQLAAERRAKYVEVRGRSQLGQGLVLKDKYCTFLLPLTADPEALWENFEGRARKAVRKAQASGLVVARGHYLISPFAKALAQHMRDLGTPFHRANFYRNIFAEFAGQAELLMVCRDGHYIGGVLLVTFRETLFPLYGGALMQYRAFSPMSLLIWQTIRYGCERGFACIDFGRSRWGSGSALFKRQWGAHPVPLFYEYHLADRVTMPDVDPTNPRYRLLIAAWRRLPLWLAKAIGHRLIRDIA
jgi:FemAB-related protein (PEP-CTERM system-associated)